MDAATRSLLNSVTIAVLGATLTLLSTWFWRKKNAAVEEAARLAEEQKKLNQRVIDLEAQLGAVKQAVVPISAAFQAILIKELTHFHTPRMDELLKKVGPPTTLTAEEYAEFEQLLDQRTRDMDGRISESERDAAIMLPMVIRRVISENATDDPVRLKIVTTPVKATTGDGAVAEKKTTE